MRFGPVPLAQALGAVLAHSVPTPGGRLRKGMVLDAPAIEALQQAGLETVTVAQLEPGDLDEDSGAARLGAALCAGAGAIEATPAATGRVNLIAKTPGLVVIDAARIAAVNGINPMISCATVPVDHQIHAGGMIATVKIISYAVPEADIQAAEEAAAGALRLMFPKGLTAELIVTQTDAGADETKGIAATRARLEALGASLEKVHTIAHCQTRLAEILGQSSADLVLILTGSATSDAQDVAPAALAQAGGRLIRFGMPVDPGNLLFLGELAGRHVLGLPGCARSPARNGADLVLGKLLCGMPVSGADIAAMGVGGLLKEIPTRPRPRRG